MQNCSLNGGNKGVGRKEKELGQILLQKERTCEIRKSLHGSKEAKVVAFLQNSGLPEQDA